MPKVKDLTVEELKTVILDTITESIQDMVEDILALSSEEYLCSIQEARNDYKEGKVKSFEDIFGI